jgi:hypothetical protein
MIRRQRVHLGGFAPLVAERAEYVERLLMQRPPES